jgi:hypothetical protein
MRIRSCVLVSVALLSGCAAPVAQSADGRSAAHQAMQEAFGDPPSAEPVLLPPLNPPVRRRSEIEAMPHPDLARWILPAADAQRVAGVELHRDRWAPRVNAITFTRAPRRTEMPGLCEIGGWAASLRVPNESSLTYQQHLDPPLQPYQYRPFVRWKVGSTLAAAGSAADCAAAAGEGFEAPSAEAAFRAANAVEQAQQRPDRFRIVCTLMQSADVGQEPVFPACPKPTELLRRLTPNLIKSVQRSECTSATGISPRGCLRIEYHDPHNPGTYSFYAVTVPAEPRLRSIRIAQGMMPPH